jgi:RimJ/RimL family protein N-acetyltransferase
MVEPFPEYAWPEVWVWMEDFRRRIIDDFGPQTLEAWVEFGQGVAARARTWGVFRGEELGGLITFERQSPVMGISHAIFKQSFWGRATTVRAMREVYGKLFSEGTGDRGQEEAGDKIARPTLQKIASVVFEDNHAMRDLARRGGAVEEGVFRGHTVREGKLVAMVAIGLTKGDFENGTDIGAGRAHRVRGKHKRGADQHQHGDEHAVVHAGADLGAERAGERHLDGAG